MGKTENTRWPLHSLILAGGRSSRMGTDKALLPLDGGTLLEWLTVQLLAMTESVTIAAGNSDRAASYREALSGCREELASCRVKFVVDAYPGDGPLAGLHAGLSALPRGYAFVMACDMPTVSRKLLGRLAAMATDGNGEADVVHVAGQPFHALYHTRVAGALTEALENRDFRVMRLLNRLKTIEVPAEAGADAGADGGSLSDEERLHNLNSPEDYRNYMKVFNKSGFQHNS